MEPYEQEQWKELDRRLAEAEKQLLATANLVRAGIPMVVSQQMRIDALIDSDARLYLRMQELAELQGGTDEKLAHLAEVQGRTDEKLTHLAEVQERTEAKLVHLADSVQKLVDSWKSGGNGAH
jgi:hypothetical protein